MISDLKAKESSNTYSVVGATEQRAEREITLQNRTLSSSEYKLKPLNSLLSTSQSEQFNRGLTYVVIKGRLQSSKKYIIDKMQPYGPQPFQSRLAKKNANKSSRSNILESM